MKISSRFIMGIVAAVVLLGGFAVIALRGRPAVYMNSQGTLQSGTVAQPAVAPQTQPTAGQPQPQPQTQPQTQPQQVSTFSMAQVATHNSAAGCWTVINGSVYDLTTWIPRHPGGPEVIIGMCGIDGTNAFYNQHNGSRSALYFLGLLKIGTLQ